MTLKLTNTLNGKQEVFEPLNPDRLTMYVCGPTVYSYAHIGNARAVVVYDVLYRYLKKTYPEVIYARNITDVDDKITKAAQEQNVDISVITEKFAQIYREDMAALHNLPPDLEPKATAHIDAMIEDIQALIENGHAYEAEGHVLFNVTSFADYGRLSNRNRDDMIAGARVEVAPYKKDPADFVLWKPSSDDMPGWDSPWGRGRPGWHIECTSMIRANLGMPIDIHGGGQDLIFPHHENELAQGSCCLPNSEGDRGYARYWIHNGFVNIEGEKMAKSEGNILLVHDLVKNYPGEVIRLALLSSHYRQPLNWTEERLRSAKQTLDGIYRILLNLSDVAVDADAPEIAPAVLKALEDDLNTPRAMTALYQLAKDAVKEEDAAKKAKLKSFILGSGEALGLLQSDPAVWFKTHPGTEIDEAAIEGKLAARDQARQDKDYARADEIRDELLAAGILLEDTPDGTNWRSL